MTDLENAVFFSVPLLRCSRQTLTMIYTFFNICLTRYGALKYLCAIKFLSKSRKLAIMQLLCNGPALHLHIVERQIVANRNHKTMTSNIGRKVFLIR
jgi:hypothetical protein